MISRGNITSRHGKLRFLRELHEPNLVFALEICTRLKVNPCLRASSLTRAVIVSFACFLYQFSKTFLGFFTVADKKHSPFSNTGIFRLPSRCKIYVSPKYKISSSSAKRRAGFATFLFNTSLFFLTIQSRFFKTALSTRYFGIYLGARITSSASRVTCSAKVFRLENIILSGTISSIPQ